MSGMTGIKPVILIPALDPDQKLITLIEGLCSEGFDRIVIIDDGSQAETQPVFKKAEDSGCTVLHHEKNQGKGEAIKTGIRATQRWNTPVITVDADGQHLPKDVAMIARVMQKKPDALVLGVRDFDDPNVPKRSRMGNCISAAFFKLSTGVRLHDTQTGLRGIPVKLFPLALATDGARYEYEMNFLIDAAGSADLVPMPIETVYEEGNRRSHFRTVRDSIRVFGRPLRFAAASLVSAGCDFLFFFLFLLLLRGNFGTSLLSAVRGIAAAALSGMGSVGAFLLSAIRGLGDNGGSSLLSAVFFATVLARLCSGGINFLLGKYFTFRSKENGGAQALRYLALFFAQMLLSAGLTSAASLVIPSGIAKALVDTVLFFISYNVQRRWVFGRDSRKRPREGHFLPETAPELS